MIFFYLLYKYEVAKLGTTATKNFLSGERERRERERERDIKRKRKKERKKAEIERQRE